MKLFTCCLPSANKSSTTKYYYSINSDNKNSNDSPTNILELNYDLYTDVIIPYFNSNTFITFAGVCSEWRRIAKQYKGFKYVNVKHKLSIFEVESLKDDEMSGLSKGDLSELFSEIEIIKFPIPIEDYNICSRSLFKKLFNSRKIETLTLCNTNLITIVIPAKNISPITSLKLYRVQMTIDNLRTICTSLQNLTDLTLVDNELDYKATVVITNSKLNRLEKLTICDPIGNEGVNQIITRPGNIRTLKKLEFFSKNRYSYSPLRSGISYSPPIYRSILPNLESFSIDIELKNSTKSIMNVLRSGNLWKELTFTNNNLDDQCMKQIGNIHSIQRLCLLPSKTEAHPLISYSYLLPLQNNLTQLEIGHVNNKTLSDLSEGKFLNLKHLSIRSNTESEIDEFVMKKLCEKIPNVTHLKLRKMEMKSGYIMSHISQLVKLTDLRILKTNIDSEGMKYLSGMSNLTRLDLGSGTLDGISYLCNGSLSNLRTLKFTKKLSFNRYDLAFASCLADGANIPKLRYLSFYHDFDYDAMKKLISGEGHLLKNLIHLEFIWVNLPGYLESIIANNLTPKFLSGSGGIIHVQPEVIPKLKSTKVNFMNGFDARRIDEFIDDL